ncbi:MAG: asparagine--tRNA ligase [Mycoplasmataceae bacterium]|nr:asparagine--tRNA ligase [Mycoplasmataceae bacterium]
MQVEDIKEILCNKQNHTNTFSVRGWVKSNRDSGKIGFCEVNDGSCLENMQVVYKKESTTGFDEIKTARTGAAILATGVLKPNKNDPNVSELIASQVVVLKQASTDYPLQKKQHSWEFLRDVAHLRPRTTTMAAIMRVRSVLSYAIHAFFQSNDYLWIASPIITSNDAEGAGENFEITNDPKNPFFDKQGKLTVSGQLNAEAYAQAFGKVYTFGPTFRAERSHTSRHMAEFWMVEPEIAFIDLQQLIAVIEVFIKNIVKYVYEKCLPEINFFAKDKPHIIKRIEAIINKDFAKVEYKKAIELLQQAKEQGVKFENDNIFFGMDLASEHERYVCEKIYNCPTFIYNYPKAIKAFYMKANSDNLTVASTDLLVEGVGEIVGGSQREDDYDKLMQRCSETKMDISSIQWYLDLRKYGYHSSSGFGLGFERLIMYILDLENIRETIPFPRVEGSLKF